MAILRKRIKGRVYLYEKRWDRSAKRYVWRYLGPEEKVVRKTLEVKLGIHRGTLPATRRRCYWQDARLSEPGKIYCRYRRMAGEEPYVTDEFCAKCEDYM